MPLLFIREDITELNTEAIVNAANSDLRMGGGVCGAIFRAAGAEQLTKACHQIGHCPTGSAVITPGFSSKASWIIHAVGPVWSGGRSGEEYLLRRCYHSALLLARQHGIHRIAFPLISSGIYGYPKAEAFRIATEEIREFLTKIDDGDMEVTLVLFDAESYLNASWIVGAIRSLVREDSPAYLAGTRMDRRLMQEYEPDSSPADDVWTLPDDDIWQDFSGGSSAEDEPTVSEFRAPSRQAVQPEPLRSCSYKGVVDLSNMDWDTVLKPEGAQESSFFRLLTVYLERYGLTEPEAYKASNIDRKLFSKLRSPDYRPGRSTVMALCIGVGLTRMEADLLLSYAGYALSPVNPLDRVVAWCIDHHVTDVIDVNTALFDLGLPLLN